jgi:hypothetical protein
VESLPEEGPETDEPIELLLLLNTLSDNAAPHFPSERQQGGENGSRGGD